MPKSRDIIKQEFETKLSTALASSDEKQLADVMTDFAMEIQSDVLATAAEYKKKEDKEILASRGVRVLTNEETEYYSKIIEAMKKVDPKSAITGITDAMPKTVIEQVTDDIIKDFPLLDAVDFKNTGAITNMIINGQARQTATWGALNSQITTALNGAFSTISVTHNKLSAYIPVSQDMLAEGPQWLDAYVRAILAESIGLGLCQGIVAGNGLNQPIGMIKDLAEAVDPSTGYADKTATAVTKLDVKGFGTLAASLATDGNGRPRPISEILIVVNPVDYFSKILPASTYLTNVGTYVRDIFPFPTRVIQDVNVPSNKAIFGIGKNYKLCVGVGGTGGRIEYSDEAQFIEDNRVYKSKVFANGRAIDNTSFILGNIANLAALQ
jgi:hypothetical protein